MSEEARMDRRWAPFVVESFQLAHGNYAPIGKAAYPTMRAALDAAAHLEQHQRYAGRMLFINTTRKEPHA